MAKRPVTKAAAAAGDAALIEEFKDFEGIKVIERRLSNPDMPGSLPIRLKDEPTHTEDPHATKRKWYVRWIDGSADGRTSQVLDGLGYVPVKITEVQNAEMVMGLHKSDDGVVRRGDRGHQWLAKMPLQLYNAIKRKQQEKRERRDRNAKLVKEDLANAAGRQLGSEAGDSLHDDFSVSVSKTRSTYGDELHDEA